jgi:hypothetical protein
MMDEIHFGLNPTHFIGQLLKFDFIIGVMNDYFFKDILIIKQQFGYYFVVLALLLISFINQQLKFIYMGVLLVTLCLITLNNLIYHIGKPKLMANA